MISVLDWVVLLIYTGVFAEMVNEMFEGEIDATILDLIYAVQQQRKWLKLGQELGVQVVDESFIDDPPLEKIGIITQIKDQKLRAVINKSIKTNSHIIEELLSIYYPNIKGIFVPMPSLAQKQ